MRNRHSGNRISVRMRLSEWETRIINDVIQHTHRTGSAQLTPELVVRHALREWIQRLVAAGKPTAAGAAAAVDADVSSTAPEATATASDSEK